MKKKIFVLVLSIVILSFIFGGCATNKVNKQDNHQENTSKNKETTILDELQTQLGDVRVKEFELVDPDHILEKVKDLHGGTEGHSPRVITTDGEVYSISLRKLFSNETNFQKVDSPISYERFIEKGDPLDRSYILGTDNKLYERRNITEEARGGSLISEDYGSAISNYTNLAYWREASGRELIRLEDGKLYVCSTGKLLEGFPEGVVVEAIWDDTIKTNDGWYIREAYCINQDEVDKYAGVVPEYEYKFTKVVEANIDFFRSTGGVNGYIIEDGKLFGVGYACIID